MKQERSHVSLTLPNSFVGRNKFRQTFHLKGWISIRYFIGGTNVYMGRCISPSDSCGGGK